MVTIRNIKALAAVLFFAVSAWSQTPQEIVFNSAGLIAAVERFNAGKSDVNIIIGADFEITRLTINNPGRTLTIMSATSTPRTLSRETTEHLFLVQKGTLVLQNITIDGKSKVAHEMPFLNKALVRVTGGGIFNMNDGTTLQNNNISGDNGAGVYVDSSGTFNMSGGLITGNKTNLSGGGVYIYALRATFNMSGGIITGNQCGTSATSYSGGVHFANSPYSTDKNPDKTPSVFRLGGSAVIKGNYKADGSSSNVYMAGNRYITLAPPLKDEMEIWVTKVAEYGVFVNKDAKGPTDTDLWGDAKYFRADGGSYVAYDPPGKLKMVTDDHDIELSESNVILTAIVDYTIAPQGFITVTNTGTLPVGKPVFNITGEDADKFELDLTGISGNGIGKGSSQSFSIKPKEGLEFGIYRAFVLVSVSANLDGGGAILMRRLNVDFMVGELFNLKVKVAAGEQFAIPLSGMLGGNSNWGKSYNWKIDWGDETIEEKASTDAGAPQNALTSAGITHTYAAAGEYTISIASNDPDGGDAWLGAFGFNKSTAGANAQANKAKVIEVLSPITKSMTRSQAQIATGEAPTHEWAFTFYECKNLVIGSGFKFPSFSQTEIDKEGALYATFFGISPEQTRDIISILNVYSWPSNAKFTFAGNNTAYEGFEDLSYVSALWGGDGVKDMDGLMAKLEEFENFPNRYGGVTANISADFINSDCIDESITINGSGTFAIKNEGILKRKIKRCPSLNSTLFTVTGGAELSLENILVYDDMVNQPLVNGPLSMKKNAAMFGIGSSINDVLVGGSYTGDGENAIIIAWDGSGSAYKEGSSDDLTYTNSSNSNVKAYWEKWPIAVDNCDVYYEFGSNKGHIGLNSVKCSEYRTLYFNQSDGKFYASDEYDDIGAPIDPIIFLPRYEISIPGAVWNAARNTLTLTKDLKWETTAPYALYFVQPTPVTLVLEYYNNYSFKSTRAATNAKNYSAGIVSRGNLSIIGDYGLKATGGSANNGSYGIYSHEGLTITMSDKSYSVEATGETEGYYSKTGSLKINGGTFIVSGGTRALPELKDIEFHGNFTWQHSENFDGTSSTPGTASSYSYNEAYKWLEFEVNPPRYAFYATASTFTPVINEDLVNVRLTLRDVNDKGAIYTGLNGSYTVNLAYVNASNGSKGSYPAQVVTFKNGIGDYVDLEFESKDSLILWFEVLTVPDLEDSPTLNPVIITPVEAPNYDISLTAISLTSNDKDASKEKAPLLATVTNIGNQPTGALKITFGGENPEAFAILNNNVARGVAVGGTATFQIVPKGELPAGEYSATITVSGEHNIEESIAVSFTVKGKLLGASVATPELKEKSATSIFIKKSVPDPNNGQEVEYAISLINSKDNLTFISFNSILEILQFDGLTRNSIYYIFARSKENADYYAGEISDPLDVKTAISEFYKCVAFDQIAVVLWSINGGPGNTMTAINNPDNNGGFNELTDFVWFKDGQELIKDQSWSAGPNGEQFQPGTYHVEMTATDGSSVVSCEYIVPEQPDIAQKTIVIDWNNIEFADVYSLAGKHLAKISTAAELRPIKNAYVLVIKTKTGTQQTIKATEALR